MPHLICRLVSFESVGPLTLKVRFDDGTDQTIHFGPILSGPLFGPLRDPKEFDAVRIDPEAHTLVWPSGADFDPATLHDWPAYAQELRDRARAWKLITA